ncbi:HTH-type transcriptional regulator CysL [Pseudodesulfovibrio hydrargyri]|uniref:HTH-type transcriptional regulator CysL n=1 Tax=Pseudodesulfovibrio hydrargyri TaxID=2125990 RepID=A0A1J5NCV4_9BACT|nr:LysR family transcriptional regulator [Pseudodesulfovibrio hydrargyri]OIQ51063.1 HTH-type transcriptional regulator CysL [Pseudodesulfovibrio hydrargyri]
MLPDLNRLKVFHFIFTEKSVAGAARKLHVSPSAVSQALNKLEGEMDVVLFTRSPSALVPTYAGEQLARMIGPFLRDLDTGVARLQQARQVPSGMLRIGSPIEFGNAYLPAIMAGFRESYPEVTFTLKLADTAELLSMVRNGVVDFGLVDDFFLRDRLEGGMGPCAAEPLIDEEVVLACSREYYEKAIAGDHSFAHLAGREFVAYRESSLTLAGWFLHHFGKPCAGLNRVLFADSHQAIISGIRAHLGLGVIASHLVRKELAAGSIVPIRTGAREIVNTISLAQLLDKIPNLTERTFLGYLRNDVFGPDGLLDFSGAA